MKVVDDNETSIKCHVNFIRKETISNKTDTFTFERLLN
jgi:hypothetical protein